MCIRDSAQTSVGAELKDKITQFDVKYDISMIGIVERTGDGVVFVRGLEGCKYGELLQFENEAYGIVLNLEMDRVGAVLLNGVTDVTEGSMVRHTGDEMCIRDSRRPEPQARTYSGNEPGGWNAGSDGGGSHE